MTENAFVFALFTSHSKAIFVFLVKPGSRCQIEVVRGLKAEGRIVSKKSS